LWGVAGRVALLNVRYVKRKLSLKAVGSDCGHLAAPLFGRTVTQENAFLNAKKHTLKNNEQNLIAFWYFLEEVGINGGEETKTVIKNKKKVFKITGYVLRHGSLLCVTKFVTRLHAFYIKRTN
jgi:hypothetical protein